MGAITRRGVEARYQDGEVGGDRLVVGFVDAR
jgi:hypothetical protein